MGLLGEAARDAWLQQLWQGIGYGYGVWLTGNADTGEDQARAKRASWTDGRACINHESNANGRAWRGVVVGLMLPARAPPSCHTHTTPLYIRACNVPPFHTVPHPMY